MGKRNELVIPTSAPPFATTSASLPPEEDSPIPALREVNLLKPCNLTLQLRQKTELQTYP